LYKAFISFWDSTISTSTINNFENELEIDEISSLFKLWTKNKFVLSDEYILKLLNYFFPTIDIAEDKFVLNITSNLWDKFEDINKALPYIKQHIKTNHNLSLISFDDIYAHYQTYCTEHSRKYIVSKRYFEKYLYHKFIDYIVYDKFIKVEWINT